MPEFQGVENFPSSCDHLSKIPLEQWSRFLFARLSGDATFGHIRNRIEERVGFLPLDQFRFAPEYTKIYAVHAHWALYCENYLEGFHIPFVHQELNALIDYGSYNTVCYDDVVIQIGYGAEDSDVFDLPEDHIDAGHKVAAYYFWIYPNLMLNYYPWGLQINLIQPVAPDLTKVHFLYYMYNDSDARFESGDVMGDKVEREDEFVVEGVMQGLQSRFYQHGRFSPRREKGVHYFQSKIADVLQIK